MDNEPTADVSKQHLADLKEAVLLALEYLDSGQFPHKAPSEADRKPVVTVLRKVLGETRGNAATSEKDRD